MTNHEARVLKAQKRTELTSSRQPIVWKCLLFGPGSRRRAQPLVITVSACYSDVHLRATCLACGIGMTFAWRVPNDAVVGANDNTAFSVSSLIQSMSASTVHHPRLSVTRADAFNVSPRFETTCRRFPPLTATILTSLLGLPVLRRGPAPPAAERKLLRCRKGDSSCYQTRVSAFLEPVGMFGRHVIAPQNTFI